MALIKTIYGIVFVALWMVKGTITAWMKGL